MKAKISLAIVFILGVFGLAAANVQTARLQVIHNAADPNAASVDVYVNDDVAKLDDFAFRAATAFLDVPTDLNVKVAPPSSASSAEVIASFDFTLQAGGKYIAIANGVLDPSGFESIDANRSIGFDIYPIGDAREMAADSTKVDFMVFHGSNDAPAVDVLARGVGTLVDDADYGQNTPYLSVDPASYLLDITPAQDNNTVVATFQADLSGLAGGAAVVFASGFLTPSNDQNGPAFGLYAALPDGNVMPFSAVTTSVHDDILGLPDRYELGQNYPNPFNPSTMISFDLPNREYLQIRVFDMLGREVATLFEGFKEAGRHNLQFDAAGLTTGLYYYQLKTENFVSTRKMLFTK